VVCRAPVAAVFAQPKPNRQHFGFYHAAKKPATPESMLPDPSLVHQDGKIAVEELKMTSRILF
jgi:hypothetical protein